MVKAFRLLHLEERELSHQLCFKCLAIVDSLLFWSRLVFHAHLFSCLDFLTVWTRLLARNYSCQIYVGSVFYRWWHYVDSV